MENLLSSFTPPGAVPGTGLKKVIELVEKELGPEAMTPALEKLSITAMPGIFGDYPNSSDIVPCSIFIGVYSIFALAHFFVFFKNRLRGQNFYISFGLMWYALFRVIGFGLRIKWAGNSLLFNIGIASVVFCQLPTLFLNVLCMILGHRIFTWRHPETGNSIWFSIGIIGVYVLTVPLVAMAILGQVIPDLFFLGEKHLRMCQQVAQAGAILNLLYATSGTSLVHLAYLFKPGTIDHRIWRKPKAKEFPHQDLPPVAQPTWIRSTALFYYPRKGDQIIIWKNGPMGKAIRIMPSKEAPAGGLCRNNNEEHGYRNSSPSIKAAIYLVVIVSIILTMNAAFRAASTFVLKPRGGPPVSPISSWIFNSYVYYVWYGGFEAIVNIILLLGRIDLRFYIPDMAKDGDSGMDEEYGLEEAKQTITMTESVLVDCKK